MNQETMNLWKHTPEDWEEIPTITAYVPEVKMSDGAVVIFPGGGYGNRVAHEGDGYARFLCDQGISAFVCDYRVSPNRFPAALLDARRAIQFVRYHANFYGLNKKQIAVMGSSAGGHLAALASTYLERTEIDNTDEIDGEDFVPNAQILCYPVIKLSVDAMEAHVNSCIRLLGMEQLYLAHELTPQYIVSEKTPQCFIWHTMTDGEVPVANSLDYACALKNHKVPCEIHIFPEGSHGLGLALEGDSISRHVSQWRSLLLAWLTYIGFLHSK